MYVLFQGELELSKLPGMREVDVAPKSHRKRHSGWVEDDDGLLEASYVDTTENIYVLTAVKTALYARHEGP